MKRFVILIIRKSWKFFYCGFPLILLILLMITFNWFSDSPQCLFYKSRLRSQNLSTYHFVKFRNLSILINTCENMTTIQCLNYLHNNQTDYIQPLSINELNFFQNQYCTEKNKMLFHTFWNNPNTLNDPLLLLHIQSHLYTQNRQCSILIIWTLSPFYGNIDQKFNVHKPYLQFRTLKPFAQELLKVGVDVRSFLTSNHIYD
jgi:hypothetical protein